MVPGDSNRPPALRSSSRRRRLSRCAARSAARGKGGPAPRSDWHVSRSFPKPDTSTMFAQA
eukprot:7315155-Pyramimonas_sp.AAC.1